MKQRENSLPVSGRKRCFTLSGASAVLAWTGLLLLAGCSHFKPKPDAEYVYVTAKETNLRDRVAAVSNRTGMVENGEKLKVLDHGRHFVKVQTPDGKIGWIEEKLVATEDTSSDFDKLGVEHRGDPVIASAVVRDQVYLHLRPGRETPRFYLLEENDKLQLLRRATIEKTGTGDSQAKVRKAIPQAVGSNAAKPVKPAAPTAAATPAPAKVTQPAKPGAAGSSNAAEPPPPIYEDWWLVRDQKGHTGWMLSRMMDVDAPDSLTRYAEGQRFVGAYQLNVVHDDNAPTDQKDFPEYVTVLSPYKAGLPYDFDQVRVFTWSLNHHRYETAFRQKNIEGYLPVTVTRMKDPYGKQAIAQEELPAFIYKVLAADAPPVTPDPETGAMKPAKLVTKTYRLEGNLVHRILAPGQAPEDEAHPAPEEKKEKKGKRK